MTFTRPKRQFKIGLVLLAYVAFISLGLPDGLLGVAWPSMRADFALPLDALGMLLVASTAGYLTSSFFSGRITAWLGVGGLLAASCVAIGGEPAGLTPGAVVVGADPARRGRRAERCDNLLVTRALARQTWR